MSTETTEAPKLAIAEYSPTAAALADLRARFADVAFDVTTTAGDKEARAARLELVKLRTSLEAKRKELKAPALERSRLIDTEAKRIEAEILALETPIDAQIKAEEQRREQERQRKAEVERRRVAEIQERIDRIKAFPVRAAGKSSIVVEALIGDMASAEVDDSFAEFRPAAERAHAESLAALREMYGAALVHEDDARQLRAEREALERQRQEDEARRAEQDRVAREQREAEEARLAEARAAQEAELRAQREAEEARLAEQRRAQEDELRRQREIEAAAIAEQQRAEAERQTVEAARIAAERAEVARQQAEIDRQRRGQEEREAAARAEEQRQTRERQQAEFEYECRLAEGAPPMVALLTEALDLVPRVSDDDPMAPALADWCHRVRSQLREIDEPGEVAA